MRRRGRGGTINDQSKTSQQPTSCTYNYPACLLCVCLSLSIYVLHFLDTHKKAPSALLLLLTTFTPTPPLILKLTLKPPRRFHHPRLLLSQSSLPQKHVFSNLPPLVTFRGRSIFVDNLCNACLPFYIRSHIYTHSLSLLQRILLVVFKLLDGPPLSALLPSQTAADADAQPSQNETLPPRGYGVVNI